MSMNRNLLFKNLVLLVLLLVANVVWAQEVTVTGQVTGADDGLGIPSVNVRVKGT